MRMIFLFGCIVLTIHLSAQSDSSFKKSIAPTYTNGQTINRTDIERLPAYNFLDLIQGAFPFVGNESQIEANYSFVINGFVLMNPNVINISQIESISFYPAGTNLTRGSFTKKGTFVILTRPSKTGLSISTKTGLTLPDDEENTETGVTKSTNGLISLNDVNFSHKSERSFVSTSFAFLKNKSPKSTYTNYAPPFNYISSNSAQLKKFVFSNFAGYQFNSQWKIEGGLFLAKQPQTYSQNISGDYTAQSGSEKAVDYRAAHVSLQYDPANKLKNQLTAEVNGGKNHSEQWSNTNASGRSFSSLFEFNGRYYSYSFSDNLLWQVKTSPSFSLDFSLLTRYRYFQAKEKATDNINQGSGAISSSLLNTTNKAKSLQVSPAMLFNWKEIVFAQFGGSYDNYSYTPAGTNQNSKILPNAGLKMDASSIINVPFLSSLQLSGNYNKYITSFDRNDWFGRRENSTPPPDNNLMVLNPDLFDNPPVQNWLASFSAGFQNDRYMFNVHYRKFEKMIRSYSLEFLSPSVTFYKVVSEPLTVKGWCFELRSSIIEKENKSWKMDAMLFQDNYSKKYPLYSPPVNALILDAGKAPWRGGIRTSLFINRFFTQASVLVNFNAIGRANNGDLGFDTNQYDNNYLLIGYALLVQRTGIKKLEVNVQSRDLFYSKDYAQSKYIGVGLQLGF